MSYLDLCNQAQRLAREILDPIEQARRHIEAADPLWHAQRHFDAIREPATQAQRYFENLYPTYSAVQEQIRRIQATMAPIQEEARRAMEALRLPMDVGLMEDLFEPLIANSNFELPPLRHDGLQQMIRREVRQGIEDAFGGEPDQAEADEPCYGSDGVKRTPGY